MPHDADSSFQTNLGRKDGELTLTPVHHAADCKLSLRSAISPGYDQDGPTSFRAGSPWKNQDLATTTMGLKDHFRFSATEAMGLKYHIQVSATEAMGLIYHFQVSATEAMELIYHFQILVRNLGNESH